MVLRSGHQYRTEPAPVGVPACDHHRDHRADRSRPR
jgi:hypothetical protein